MALFLFLEVLKIDRNEVMSLNDWIESQEAARPNVLYGCSEGIEFYELRTIR